MEEREMQGEWNEFDGDVEFEEQLRVAMRHVDAPTGLKHRILAAKKRTGRVIAWPTLQRMAATVLLTAGLSGALLWHHHEEEKKAEAAQQQLTLALAITNHALHHVQERLAEKGRAQD